MNRLSHSPVDTADLPERYCVHRRLALRAMAGASWALSGLAPIHHAVAASRTGGLSDSELVLGSSLALTGPLASGGQAAKAGLTAALEEANAAGGVHGRKLVSLAMDDGYAPDRTVSNVKQMLSEESVFAMISCLGTANIAATLPLTESAAIPYIGATSGAASLRRADHKYVFHIRASYSDETVSLVQQILNMGLKSIGIVYLDNAFGKEVASNAEKIITDRQLKLAGSAALAVDGRNVSEAVDQVMASNPSAVLLGTSGSATVQVLRKLKERSSGLPVACLSVSLTTADATQLGSIAQGTVMTRVVPLAHRATSQLSRSYQAAMKAYGGGQPLDQRGFESYINGRVLIEALKRCGRGVTRERLREQLASLGTLDLGGFSVTFRSPGPFVGSKYVELSIVGPNGSLIG